VDAFRISDRVERLITASASTLGAAAAALRLYLDTRHPALPDARDTKAFGYASSVATLAQGAMDFQWKGCDLPLRQALIAAALLDLVVSEDGRTEDGRSAYSRPVGDVSNLRTKLSIMVSQHRDAAAPARSRTDTRNPPDAQTRRPGVDKYAHLIIRGDSDDES
jgi:hypothetical protein